MSQEWKLVPVEPTENMVINGFESVPDEGFTDEEVWEHYQDMSGCQQAAFRAKLCWAAMLASAPLPAANVDPAVVGHFYEGDVMGDQFSKLSLKHYYRRHGAAEHEYIQPVALIRQEDHRTHMIRQQAEIAALQQRLNVADQRIDDLEQDKARLDSIEVNYWDVRHHSSPIADTGDHSTSVEIIGHWMDKPHERVIGENYNENLRAAIDQAMTADAYPPARPEYPTDADIADADWHMNPCKQGHRDVGACQGKAFCHTCDETITAATTQEAFEQWNATHPATSQ
jgi:hypothetical protein